MKGSYGHFDKFPGLRKPDILFQQVNDLQLFKENPLRYQRVIVQ
jgi:hypothetical protein